MNADGYKYVRPVAFLKPSSCFHVRVALAADSKEVAIPGGRSLQDNTLDLVQKSLSQKNIA
jgi:hypothetical protein